MTKRVSTIAGAIATTAVTGSVLAATPANAADYGGGRYIVDGRVVSKTSLLVRSQPTTTAQVLGSLKPVTSSR